MVKDKSIQIVRVIAMIFIVLCHLFQKIPNNILIMSAQFFNVGVFIFLFISGYLYGKKNITNYIEWIKKRFKTIIIPMYIFIIIISICLIFKDAFNIKYIFIYMFNVQYFFGSLSGTGHLWFLSIIMICYIILLLLNKKKELIVRNKCLIIIILTLLAIIISFISLKWSLVIWYIITFIIGYTWNSDYKNIFIVSLICVFSIFGRVICQKLFDNSFVYDGIIVPFLQIILAITLYIIIKYTYIKFEQFFNRKEKILNYFDEMSYYIYISHYVFFDGLLSTIYLTNNIFINMDKKDLIKKYDC